MAGDGKAGKWNQRAWTPDRCALWKALSGDLERQKEFENWVDREPEFNYPAQVSAEWLAKAAKTS